MHFHVRGGSCGPSSGAADDVIVGVWVQFVDAQWQLVHWDVDRAGDVSGIEFVGIAHIEDVGVVGHFVDGEGFKVVHVAMVDQENAPRPAKQPILPPMAYTVKA